MNPPEFFINTGSGFIEMSKTRFGNLLFDSVYRFRYGISTASYHAAYGTGGDRDIEHTGENFMRSFHTDSSDRI